jgi:hypothetical protein
VSREAGGPPWTGREGLALAALLAAAAFFFTWNNRFPIGLHADEGKKVRFILGASPDFHHPLLLIQAARWVRPAVGAAEPEVAALAGRAVSAAAGVAVLALFYLLARPAAGRRAAWAGAAALAATPLVAVHAHYVKEDMVFTAAVLAAALAWRAWLRSGPSAGRAAWLGASLGLAGSCHYKAVLLAGLVGWTLTRGARPHRASAGQLAGLAAAALAILVLVHGRELARVSAAGSGAGLMFADAVGGQDVDFYPVPYFFSFHLTRSLVPGLGAGLLGFAAAGAWLAWRAGARRSVEDGIALVWCVAFYLAVEFSPKKPPPDFGRYVLPCAPFLVWLALRGVAGLWARWRPPVARILLASLAALAIAAPAWRAAEVVGGMGDDTRLALERRLTEQGGGMRVLREDYAAPSVQGVQSLAFVDLERARLDGYTHVAASSFRFERYLEAERIAQQRPGVARMAAFYRELFRLPYEEFRPPVPGYAFSNPTLRLVDIRKGALPAPVPRPRS